MYKWNATSISINCSRQIAGCRFTKRDPFTTLRYADSLGNDERNSSVVSRFFSSSIRVKDGTKLRCERAQFSLFLFLFLLYISKEIERTLLQIYKRSPHQKPIKNYLFVYKFIYIYIRNNNKKEQKWTKIRQDLKNREKEFGMESI